MMMPDVAETSLPMGYGYGRTVDIPFDLAIERITGTLKEEGFGILSRIDVHEKLKEKLNASSKLS